MRMAAARWRSNQRLCTRSHRGGLHRQRPHQDPERIPVVEIKNDRVILKVDEASNTRMTFARSAVQQVLSGDAEDKVDA